MHQPPWTRCCCSDAGTAPRSEIPKARGLRAARGAQGNTAIAHALIDANAHVDAVLPDGCTALMLAAQDGDEAMVQCLLNGGADLHRCTPDGRRAMQFARAQGCDAVIKALEQHVAAFAAQMFDRDHEFMGNEEGFALPGAAA